MQAPVQHILGKYIFWLSSARTLFWEDTQTLIVSDLHFGKTGHFRKSGIGVPQNIFKEDLQRLIVQLQVFSCSKLLVVGDLFHSVANKECDLFRRWRDDLPDLSIQLVKGNHDILKNKWYSDAGISVINEGLHVNGLCFTHDHLNCQVNDNSETRDATTYTISGHIHPGVRVRGLGRQSLCFPCFYFGEKFAVLPAFSRFTGTALIEPGCGDSVFAIAEGHILKIR